MTDNLSDSGKALRSALSQVPIFAQLKDEQFKYVTQGTEVWLQPGDYVARQGDPPKNFFIQLEGQTEWTRKVGMQEVYMLTHGPGVFYGHELLLTDKPYPVSGRALSTVHLYKLETDAFWSMLSSCPSILRGLVATIAERWGNLGAVEQQHAKLVSLGTMAAGLAHELNNPAAAAARRAVDGLLQSFEASQSLAFKLQESGSLSSQCLAEIGREVQRVKTAPTLDILEHSDREEEIAAWLDKHDLKNGWQMAPTLASAGLDVAWLETLTLRIQSNTLPDLLLWIEANLTTRNLLAQVKSSTERISHLVGAVKNYSYMDRAPLQEVDVHEGLESTLTMLDYKLKKSNIIVTREYDQSLPRFCAYGSQLNQVWTNLLDNAIDAVDGAGHILIRTSQEAERIVVEIADNGPGIPPQVQPRIFEPFFTTKDVGIGTGLGLDIARRIVVGQHKGDIRVFSQPEDTRFQVRLPINLSQTIRE